MPNPNGTISVIPSSNFNWTARIEFKESFTDRDEAIRYASRHGYNLIVRYSKGGTRFDVMWDLDGTVTSDTAAELVETVPVVEVPDERSWSQTIAEKLVGVLARFGAVADGASNRRNAAA
jgi:hypothetical protein